MKLSNDDLKHILIRLNRDDHDMRLRVKIEEFLEDHEHGIACPHCEGRGRVSEDFLTDEHVADVFADYCNIFGIHKAYGVDSWCDVGYGKVRVVQDISCRGCYDVEHHDLPKAYFTRDVAKRRELMNNDLKEKQREKVRKEEHAKRDHIARLENELAALKRDME